MSRGFELRPQLNAGAFAKHTQRQLFELCGTHKDNMHKLKQRIKQEQGNPPQKRLGAGEQQRLPALRTAGAVKMTADAPGATATATQGVCMRTGPPRTPPATLQVTTGTAAGEGQRRMGGGGVRQPRLVSRRPLADGEASSTRAGDGRRCPLREGVGRATTCTSIGVARGLWLGGGPVQVTGGPDGAAREPATEPATELAFETVTARVFVGNAQAGTLYSCGMWRGVMLAESVGASGCASTATIGACLALGGGVLDGTRIGVAHRMPVRGDIAGTLTT